MENNFQFTSASITDRGLSDKRPQNEDSFLELPQHGVFAVADGVGGAQAGDVASQMAVEILAEAFINRAEDSDPEEVMKLAIERANSAIFQMSHDLVQLSSMATTIVALHVDGNIATIGHVGDSRVYRADNNRRLFRETEDHSVVEEEVRAGRMTPEQALNHPSRNIISRALGAEETVEIDIKTIMVDAGTSFLMCSDGITRHIDDAEINEFLTSDLDPATICTSMKELCFSRGAEDNLTAVVVRLPAAADKLDVAPLSALPATETVENEEVTVAAARSPFDSPAVAEPLPIQRAETQAAADLSTEPADDYTSASIVVPAAAPQTVVPVPSNETVDDSAPMFTNTNGSERAASSGFIGKVLSAVGLLILGVILGFAAHYLWSGTIEPQPVAREVPVITEQKSDNIQLTNFEESRRTVDRDPQGYLSAVAASPPQIPEDFFLLGRAYLLTGQHWDAKRNFIEARNRLSQADELNAKTLATEIAMALVIIDSGPSSQAFAKEIEASKTLPANANVANSMDQLPPQ